MSPEAVAARYLFAIGLLALVAATLAATCAGCGGGELVVVGTCPPMPQQTRGHARRTAAAGRS